MDSNTKMEAEHVQELLRGLGKAQCQFLDVNEAAVLRDEVEGVRQSVYEPEVACGHRFREVADAAYRDALPRTPPFVVIHKRIII